MPDMLGLFQLELSMLHIASQSYVGLQRLH